MSKMPTFIEVMGWSEDQCYEYIESRRWPNGVACIHCGAFDPYRITRKSKTKNLVSKLYKCRECRKQFSLTTGTVFERSHVSLRLWLAAIAEVVSDKKGIAAHELHRKLNVDYRTAWHMLHRLREAMRPKEERPKLDGTVEADSTYVGGKTRRGAPAMHERIKDEMEMGLRPKRVPQAEWRQHKTVVFGMVKRGGDVRASVVEDEATAHVRPLLTENVDLPNTRLMTDGHPAYRTIKQLGPHQVIDHSLEYVRDGDVHVQNVESFWSLLKRAVNGTYHHLSPEYLDRYIDEFTWRHNRRRLTDGERLAQLLGQVEGRLELSELRNRAHSRARQ